MVRLTHYIYSSIIPWMLFMSIILALQMVGCWFEVITVCTYDLFPNFFFINLPQDLKNELQSQSKPRTNYLHFALSCPNVREATLKMGVNSSRHDAILPVTLVALTKMRNLQGIYAWLGTRHVLSTTDICATMPKSVSIAYAASTVQIQLSQ